jgi:hypothetical protein
MVSTVSVLFGTSDGNFARARIPRCARGITAAGKLPAIAGQALVLATTSTTMAIPT